jgi:hypothetical protein
MTHDDSDLPEDDAEHVKRIDTNTRRIESTVAAADEKAREILSMSEMPISQFNKWVDDNVDGMTVIALMSLVAENAGAVKEMPNVQQYHKGLSSLGGRRRHNDLANFEKWTQEKWLAWQDAAAQLDYKAEKNKPDDKYKNDRYAGETEFAEEMRARWKGERCAAANVIKRWVKRWKSGDLSLIHPAE